MAKILAEISKSEAFVGSAHSAETIKRKARELSSRRAEHEVPLAEVKFAFQRAGRLLMARWTFPRLHNRRLNKPANSKYLADNLE